MESKLKKIVADAGEGSSMPFVEVNAIHYYYEIIGPDPKVKNETGFPLPLVLTPGGQMGMQVSDAERSARSAQPIACS